MSVTTLVAAGSDVELVGDPDARYPLYSITKTVVAAAVLSLVREDLLELDSVRNLLDHTSGVRDYGSLSDYHEAVRMRPGSAWEDDEFLARTSAAGPVFESGNGWAYSNTGYLLLRRILDEHGGLTEFLPQLGLAHTSVAERTDDLGAAVPAPSAQLLDGVDDVRGVYDPRWVGHRTLIARAEDILGFWRDLPREMLDPRTFVPVGVDAPGFVRPSYGLGVMADPESPLGTVVGHGGGGPGYSTAVFAVPDPDAVAIVLAADERYPAQPTALELLTAAVRRRR
ncbi:MAG TPA: serine hydrolase domain-containing protein [Gaiellaceae bacterium]|nr:serine hydrolase domain-containing protein [Gaiellaceae bacterium]